MEGSKCLCSTDGRHKFVPFVVATLPPDEMQIKGADVHAFTSPTTVRAVIESLTAKRYLVACEHCGKTIGGYSGMVEPTIEQGEPATDFCGHVPYTDDTLKV